MAIFPVFNSSATYITPYSSSTNGGELVTEFNQRAQLNVIGWKHVKIDELNLEYDSWLTGSKSEADLKLDIVGSNLKISNGEFLINGYYGSIDSELLIPVNQITTLREFPANSPDNATIVKLVKVQVYTTQSAGNSHDERLIPNTITDEEGKQHDAIEIVIDNEKPTRNQLLLGTIICDTEGRYTTWNSPFKSKIVSLDRIAGTEKMNEWVLVPDGDTGDTVYGIQKNKDGNLVPISDWLWLHYNSPLGKFLRNLTTVPDDAGNPNKNAKPLHMIVSEPPTASKPEPSVLKVGRSATRAGDNNLYLQYRIVKNGNQQGDAYGKQEVLIPKASYDGYSLPISKPDDLKNASVGVVDPEIVKMVITMWETMGMRSPGGEGTNEWGREFGPYTDPETAESMIERLKNNGVKFKVGDYYWVLNDTVDGVPDPAIKEFGTVSGTGVGSVYGAVSVPLSGEIKGSTTKTVGLKFDAPLTDVTVVESEDVSIKIPSGKTVQLSVQGKQVPIKGVSGNVSGTIYSNSMSGTMESEDPLTISWTDDEGNAHTATGKATGKFVGTNISGGLDSSRSTVQSTQPFYGTIEDGVTLEGSVQTQEISGQVTGAKLKGTVKGHVEGTLDETALTAKGSGTADGMMSATIDCSVTGTISSFKQNVSSWYVYSPIRNENDGSIKEYGWVRRAVLRGFSTPATPNCYGFVKPSDENTEGGVVVNPENGQLRLREVDRIALSLCGWKLNADEAPVYNLSSNNSLIGELEGTIFVNPVRINLIGDGWDAESVVPLNRIRGDVILDISKASPIKQQDENGNLVATNVPLLTVKDINKITLITGGSTATINAVDCVFTPHNFNSIHRWVNNVFTSGSNTAELDNPWMTMENPFTDDSNSRIMVRFASVTRGEYGITGGELDIWIQRDDWTATDKTGEEVHLRSKGILKFPPFMLVLDEDKNVVERQDIPDSMNIKVSGTGGVSYSYDDSSSSYLMNGNWVSTLDWEHGGEFSLNARLLYSGASRHSFRQMRFRAPVQILDAHDMIKNAVDYSFVYTDGDSVDVDNIVDNHITTTTEGED